MKMAVCAALVLACGGAFAQVAPEMASPPERDGVRGVARFFRDGFPFFDARLEAGAWSGASVDARARWEAGGAAPSPCCRRRWTRL